MSDLTKARLVLFSYYTVCSLLLTACAYCVGEIFKEPLGLRISKNDVLVHECDALLASINAYYLKHGTYPTQISEIDYKLPNKVEGHEIRIAYACDHVSQSFYLNVFTDCWNVPSDGETGYLYKSKTNSWEKYSVTID